MSEVTTTSNERNIRVCTEEVNATSGSVIEYACHDFEQPYLVVHGELLGLIIILKPQNRLHT